MKFLSRSIAPKKRGSSSQPQCCIGLLTEKVPCSIPAPGRKTSGTEFSALPSHNLRVRSWGNDVSPSEGDDKWLHCVNFKPHLSTSLYIKMHKSGWTQTHCEPVQNWVIWTRCWLLLCIFLCFLLVVAMVCWIVQYSNVDNSCYPCYETTITPHQNRLLFYINSSFPRSETVRKWFHLSLPFY